MAGTIRPPERMRLTEKRVRALPVPASGSCCVWDENLPRFGVRLYSSGNRAFVVLYRNRHRRARWITVGKPEVMRLEQARKIARGLLLRIARGEDPAAERDEARGGATVKDLAERYLREHAELHKKASSVRNDKLNIDRHVLPMIGRKRVADVTRRDIARLHNSMRSTPYAANRTLALLGKMFSLAEAWGLRPENSNPTRHVQKYRETKRERFLSELELARLGKVLNEAERTQTEPLAAINAVRLLLFTGCRLGEILSLRWADVDQGRGLLHLRDSKTGAKDVVLNEPALAVIENIERGGEWLLPGAKPGTHLVGLNHVWLRIRKRARLDGVRLHDLRHCFASVGVSRGVSLPIIGGLLGHKNQSTTSRYSHLADDPLRRASEEIGGYLSNALKGSPLKLVK